MKSIWPKKKKKKKAVLHHEKNKAQINCFIS